MKTTILILGIIGLVLMSGCLEKDKKIEECNTDSDCGSRYYDREKCINNTCIKVECLDDSDCNRYVSYSPDWQECVNNVCMSHLEECKEIAIKDYNISNPVCDYIYSCFCWDYIIDSPEKRIEKENSIQIIPKKSHYERYVQFDIKK